MTPEQIESIALALGIGTLISFMVFIIWDLAKNENAGKFGALILFGTLGLGLFGFMLKIMIGEFLIA